MMQTPRRQQGAYLQPWDVELLRVLFEEVVVLTRSQIGLLDPVRSVRRINVRLLRLLQAGYLSRRFPSSPLAKKIPLYYLGPKAGPALGRDVKDESIKDRREQATHYRDAALLHVLLVNSLFLKFMTGSKAYPDYELLSWIPQYDTIWQTLSRHGMPVRADGYGEFQKSGIPFRCFIEVDRGGERGATLRRRLGGYETYLTSGRFGRHFRANSFRVLFTVTGQRRAQQLVRVTSGMRPGLFWIAEVEEVLRSPLFAPVWRCAGADTRLSLDTPF